MITISTHTLHHHKMSFLPPHLQHLQHLQGDDLKAAIQQEYYTQAIAFIVRQTDYTEETATERLAELQDPVKVVQAYLGLGRDACDKPNAIKSKNQLKYGEIRKFMDTGAKQYSAQKELNELRKKYQEHLEQQQQEKLPVFQQEKQEQPNCSNCSPAFATCDGECQGADHTLHEA